MNKNIKLFFSGVANIVSTKELKLNKYSSNYEKNDLDALRKDWEKVGLDLRGAIDSYDRR